MADRSVVLQSAAYPPRRKTWLEFYFCRSPALVGTGIGFTFKLVQPQVLLVSDDGYFPFPFAVAVSLGGLVGRMLGALEIDVDDVEVMPTAPDLKFPSWSSPRRSSTIHAARCPQASHAGIWRNENTVGCGSWVMPR